MLLKLFGLAVGVYLVMPLAVFDFSSIAVPYDEENHAGKKVAIGPRPRWWVPFAARHIDLPGGADYSPDGWTFQIWKPICVMFCRAKGYELPAEWR
jgi:hypothetical protein